MSTYLTEEQQIELLKAWWKNNGNFAIGVLFLALALSLGLHFWFKHREVKLERGSAHYEQMLNALVNGDDATTIKEASLLKDNYSHTPYAALASLIFARNDVYAEKYPEAEAQLTWVMDHASTNSLREIARLRLSRIEIQLNKPQEALKVLDKINDSSYLPMINEVRGDSYLALNDTVKARESYQKAVDLLPNYAIARPLLTMKLNDLATGNK
ncbi:MAG TPA: tetratricopeptide repeat protein [Gammaproteobacteria bacterium]|nr:tetratricopeptide repeat protein [Gammaproteobacteria bacterium]